jgi:hypothetical protein
MRRSEFSLYFMTVICIGFGAAGLYIGFFASGTICDQTCHSHKAGTVEPLSTFVGALFLLVGFYLLVRTLRRRQSPLTANGLDRAVGLGEQARLAQEMRAFYTDPGRPLLRRANPTEFDRLMLSLFDSIEAGSGDIGDRVETLLSHVCQKGFFRAYGDRFKAHLVWNKGAVALQWTQQTPDAWQLRCNWNRLLRVANVGPGWNEGLRVAPKWIGPVRQEAGVQQPT